MRWINNNYTSLPYYGGKEEKESGKEESFTVPPFSFINQNNHLPGVPSAAEVEKKGINVGDNAAAQLKRSKSSPCMLSNRTKS